MSILGPPGSVDGRGIGMPRLRSLICVSFLVLPTSGQAQADGFRPVHRDNLIGLPGVDVWASANGPWDQ